MLSRPAPVVVPGGVWVKLVVGPVQNVGGIAYTLDIGASMASKASTLPRRAWVNGKSSDFEFMPVGSPEAEFVPDNFVFYEIIRRKRPPPPEGNIFWNTRAALIVTNW